MNFVGTFWALVPPIIAITLALITKEAYSALFSSACVIGRAVRLRLRPRRHARYDRQRRYHRRHFRQRGHLPLPRAARHHRGALVNACRRQRRLRPLGGDATSTPAWARQLATFILGVLIFIDDYFNCLTVGSVMRPVTDRHQISRPKLAYLIDATAAPVCMIAPISSWAAAVSSTARGPRHRHLRHPALHPRHPL